MNEFKGTPGPWKASKTGRGIGPISGADDQSFGMMVEVAFVEFDPEIEVQVANMQLIAAAPELLEALQQLLADSESDQVTLDAEYGMARNIDEIEKSGDLPASIVMARKAIAKALGETK